MPCAVVSFLTGILIDIDHLFEHYLNAGFTFDLKAVGEAFEKLTMPKVYIVLHSYELLLAFWMVIYILSLDKLWVAAAIGVTQHIILDQIVNPISRFGYFLTYRFMKRFRTDSIITREA